MYVCASKEYLKPLYAVLSLKHRIPFGLICQTYICSIQYMQHAHRVYYTAFHRRRIKTDGKAKVVAAFWGTELIQFLAALAVLHHGRFEL